MRSGLHTPMVQAVTVATLSLLLVGWEPLWRNQPEIADGIEAYGQKKWDEALTAFAQAAKEVPDAPEIHFNQGAAQYQKAVLVDAAKRFKPLMDARDEMQRGMSLDGPAKKAALWHNLATTITQVAMLTTKEDKDGPKTLDREARMGYLKSALDGFKKSLELQSDDVDTKWNMEVAQRLLDKLEEEKRKEEEEKKKQEEQKKKDQKQDDKKDQKQDDKKDQKQDDKKDQKQDQNKDQQKQDQKKDQQKDQKQDQQKKEQEKKEQEKKEQEKKEQEKKEQQKQDQQKQDQQKKEQEKKEQEKKEQEAQAQPGQAKKAPPLDLSPLDALKNSEKPLQLYRIMMDPRKSGVKVRKDW